MRSSAFITFFHDALNAYNKMCEPILHEFDIPQVSFDILMFLKILTRSLPWISPKNI